MQLYMLNNKIPIIIFTLIILIFSSGCTDLNLGEKYSVAVLDINDYSYEKPMGGTNEINIIQVRVKNNQDSSLVMSFKKHGIVYEDGSQMGMLKGGFMAIGFPDDKCVDSFDEDYYGTFTLFPQSAKEFNLCFNKLDWNKNPKLFLSFLHDVKTNVQGAGGDIFTMNIEKEGVEKEFLLPLTKNS